MTAAISTAKSFLKDNQEYIDIVEALLEYEEQNKNPDSPWIEDTDFDSVWGHKDVGVHPSKLYQLEVNGILTRNADTNSKTKYSIVDREQVRDLLEQTKDDIQSEGGQKFAGEMKESMHQFPNDKSDLPDSLFEEIIGYDDIEWLLKRAMTTDDITNFLLVGGSGTGKSVFLMSIFNNIENSEYISSSEASSAGVLDKMFRETPAYMLIDEFDDMKKKHQAVFASYTETGIIDETKYGKDRKLKTNTKTFAAANDLDKIKDNILDRFTVLEFEPYTYDEFTEICEHLLPMKEGKSVQEAKQIADAVWDYKGEGDVRAAIQVARLSRGDPEKVVEVLESHSGSKGLF